MNEATDSKESSTISHDPLWHPYFIDWLSGATVSKMKRTSEPGQNRWVLHANPAFSDPKDGWACSVASAKHDPLKGKINVSQKIKSE